MKKYVEISGEGLDALLGEHVTIWCTCYIYWGKLVSVNEHDIQLEDAHIVYETGPLSAPAFTDVEKLPAKHWWVRTAQIESYGVWSQ